MNFDNILPVILSLIPLGLGIAAKVSNSSSTNQKQIGFVTIGALVGGLVLMRFAFEIDPSVLFLAIAILLSGFCTLLSLDDSQQGSGIFTSAMIVLGLGLGVLLNQDILSRIFLCGLLGYIASSINSDHPNNFRKKIIFLHIIIAIIFSLSSGLMGESFKLFAGIFIAVTFLPLAPFHLPFTGIIKNTNETLSSFWVVVWLIIGFGELNAIYSSLTETILFKLSLLAFVSAVYASLAALGQKSNSIFVASATVAHVALFWGLLEIFPSFPKWGISSGITLALVMSGISLTFSFVQQRYGWKTIGNLPGLAAPMPRFGVAMVLLVGFALFLPLFPTFSGLLIMPTIVTQHTELAMISLLFLVVWLIGGWYFIQMLHKTAFGEARSDVPYSDLRLTEFFAVWLLLFGATYSGIIH